MKRLFLFAMVPLLSFQQDSPFKGGKYTNATSLIYAIEISNDGDRIKFFLKENENDAPGDAKFCVYGEIVRIKKHYFVQRLNGNHISKRQQKKLEMKLEGTTVIFAANNLLNDFYDDYTLYSDDIKFEYQPY
ncbi:hypothetical protein [Flavobacterium noncentrifugens]|uniref:Uncharacterized protein n=1 Tax=Flavobacterium noncentrifugens TaxID=1128970 RepID=A0A1G8X0B4_9FLAO|nr:hypothetical protein [Flavobacterium noncentrifugens]SDJ83874.1 hypothetical protein SAMN04487935_2009 [Flavobacterium noncentrifugens]